MRRTAAEKLFGHLLEAHHYLGYARPVGEQLKYLIYAQGQPVAALAWSSAPRHLGARDRFIGWSAVQRRAAIHLVAYNTRFELEKLRCNLCGQLFTAPAPKEAGLSKYDPQVGTMLGYLRFGTGVPHYRLDRMQVDLGVRLPASTQWELMAQTGPALEPAHEALITLAAQGKVIHNDDTTMRVQSLAKEIHSSPSRRKWRKI